MEQYGSRALTALCFGAETAASRVFTSSRWNPKSVGSSRSTLNSGRICISKLGSKLP